MFIVALFIIVKNLSNQNIFQWTNKQIVVFSCNGILFSDKKINEVSSHEKHGRLLNASS